MKTVQEDIFTELNYNFNDVSDWRRYLHQHPELSFEETETAKFIAEKLTQFGLEVKSGIGGNGLVGILKGSEQGETIALRADFDALPIQDEKDVSYKSLNKGVMHACGHDGHTAALLGTAQTLSRFREKIKGTVLFIFQHAEEKPPGGAKFMIEENVLDGVDYVYGAHLASDIPLGKIALGSGYRMAAVDKFTINIKGKGGHGAMPHTTVDAVVVGSEIVTSLQKVVSRRINPLESAVVTIGVFQSGTAFNIIADTAKIEGTVRTFEDSVRNQIEEEIRAIVKGNTIAAHASYDIDYLRGYPALNNHQEETETVAELLSDTFGKEAIIDLTPAMGAEDFAYFLNERPGTYFKVGSRNESETTHFPHHHPKFDFDERALLNIEKSFVQIVAHHLF